MHRALTAPRTDYLPRDVLVKPQFYRIKKKIMSEARSKGDLTLLGHPVQIFVDISQLTIQKRQALKPLLMHLINHHIKNQWSFPFRLSFAYKSKTHSFANFREGENILLDLGLTTRDPSSPSPRQARDRPIMSIWSQQGHSSSKCLNPAVGAYR